jgi:hypothetical protein
VITRPCPHCGGELIRVNNLGTGTSYLHCNDCRRSSPLPLDLQLRENPEATPLPGFLPKRRVRRRRR